MLSATVLVNGIRRLFSSVMAPARDKFNVVFVLGGPGAGKGTQCARIVEVGGRRRGSRPPPRLPRARLLN